MARKVNTRPSLSNLMLALIPRPKRIPVKALHMTRDEYVATLDKGPWLGGGCYGDVWAHPTDPTRVIKVTKRRDNAYVRFVRCVLKYPGNRWLPVIHKAETFISLPAMAKAEDPWRILPKYGNGKRQQASFSVFELERLDSLWHYRARNKDRWPAVFARMECHHDSFAEAVLRSDGSLPPCAREVQDILDTLLSMGHALDLHSGNLMMRGTQLVITDPAC